MAAKKSKDDGPGRYFVGVFINPDTIKLVETGLKNTDGGSAWLSKNYENLSHLGDHCVVGSLTKNHKVKAVTKIDLVDAPPPDIHMTLEGAPEVVQPATETAQPAPEVVPPPVTPAQTAPPPVPVPPQQAPVTPPPAQEPAQAAPPPPQAAPPVQPAQPVPPPQAAPQAAPAPAVPAPATPPPPAGSPTPEDGAPPPAGAKPLALL